jgi:type II secretory ATPase GspE/PulE/Tfp pilus assembly ATPase PilB-like protein
MDDRLNVHDRCRIVGGKIKSVSGLFQFNRRGMRVEASMDGLYKKGSIGSILFEARIITENDIMAALAEQERCGCRFGEALVKLGIVTQEDIDWALSNQLNIPYVRLKKDLIDKDAAGSVTATLARRFNLIPLIRSGDEMSIAIADPLDKAAIDAVEQATGFRVTVSVAFIHEIREMQDYFYGMEAEEESLEFSSAHFPAGAIEAINTDNSGGRFLDYLLVFAIQNKLTTVSLQPLRETVLITARKGGSSSEIGRLAAAGYAEIALRLKKLAGIDGTSDGYSAGGMLPFKYKGKTLLFQVLGLQGEYGDYITLKPHISTPFPASIDDLEMTAAKAERFRNLAAADHGMILFAMPQSDDRNRFIELFLHECSTSGKTVLVLGKEFGGLAESFSCISLPDVAREKAGGIIGAALEHGPDILVIADVTDVQALNAASRAALSGKLVVAGLSVDGTYNAFNYLSGLTQQHNLMPTCLRGIVSCKGVLRLCPKCKQHYTPSPAERAPIEFAPAVRYFRAAGCPDCDQTGYRGRRHLIDVVSIDQSMLRGLGSGFDGEKIVRCLAERDCSGIRAEAAALLQSGDISLADFGTAVHF